MVKFHTKQGLFGIGLSRGNLVKLQQNKPIKIDLSELNVTDVKEILIFFGEDERQMKELLKDFITSDTEVRIDPRLKEH